MIVDEKTLSGVAGVLRDLKLTQPKDSLSRFGKVSSNKHHMFTKSSLIPFEVEKLEILSTFNECIKLSLSIIQNRIENYRHYIENLSSIGSIEASVANEAKDTLNIFDLNDITPPEIVGNLVKLALMEMTVAEETLCGHIRLYYFCISADPVEGKIVNDLSQIEDDQTDSSLRSEIWLLLNHGEPPLQMQLCHLMHIHFRSSRLSNSSVDNISESTCLVERDQSSLFKESLENKENTMEDFNDGVLNSIEKLGPELLTCALLPF